MTDGNKKIDTASKTKGIEGMSRKSKRKKANKIKEREIKHRETKR